MKLNLQPLFLGACLHGTANGSQIRSSSPRKLQKLVSDCTAVLVVEDFEEGEDLTYLYCETDDGLSYKVNVEEDFISRNFHGGPFVSNETRMIFEFEPLLDKSTNELVITGIPKLQAIPKPSADTVGDKPVLVVRVIATDDSTTANESFLGDSVFGTSGDPVNLKSQYGVCSHDQLNVRPCDDRTGVSTSISNGVVTVEVDVLTSQGDSVMRNAITDELKVQFGVSNPNQLADHVMYCMPPGTMSGIAYGYINSWNTVYNDYWCTYVSAQMHEVGHNLNMAHSNENGLEYADQSCLMGYSYSSSDTPEMCFNSAKSWQLGWYTSKQTIISATGLGQRQYSGELAGLMEDYYDPSVPTMLVKLNTPFGDDYFLFFNRAFGFNSGTQEGANTVMIVSSGTEGLGYSFSDLKAKLSASESWTSPAVFNGETVTVDVHSIGTRANVDICVGTCGVTDSPTPTPTIAPTITPQPTADCFNLDIEILPDIFASSETYWELFDTDGVTLIDSGGYDDFTAYELYEYTVACLPTTCGTSDSYTFVISDAFGDGLNWSTTDPGYFKVFVEGTELFGSSDGINFGSSDTVTVVDTNCGPPPSPTFTPTIAAGPPTASPSSSPTNAPSSSLTCADSGFSIAYTAVAGGTSIPCEFVSDLASDCLCDDPNVSSHCSVSCDSCAEYGCTDSTSLWYTDSGAAVSCAVLDTLDPGTVSLYCDLIADLRATCPVRCGLCD